MRTLAIAGGSPVRTEPLVSNRVHVGYEELQQIIQVFDNGKFCSVDPMAPKVPEFERAFAEYVGAKYAVAFNSCTTAQHASLVAAGVGPGDEVIVPPLTFASTAYTVLIVGATPVFVDVDDNSITLDPQRVAEAVTPLTKAIVPVHWFGFPADMDRIIGVAQQNGITIIEDCAHANGSVYKGHKAGSMGSMACWSLQESKVLTSGGEGGMLTTDSEELAIVADSIRDHGKEKKYFGDPALDYSIIRVGNNYRLSELHAAFGLAQIEKVESMQDLRKSHSQYLDKSLCYLPGISRPRPTSDVTLGYPYYPVRFNQSEFTEDLRAISDALRAEGIVVSMVGEAEFCAKYPLFREHCGPAELPVADRIRRELIVLPLYPDLKSSDLDDIVEAMTKVVDAYSISN